MPLRKEPIPWRLPYIGPSKELALREVFIHFTPVLRWATVIEPGDPIEFVHPATFVPLSCCGVVYVKKGFIAALSPIEVNLWLPGASRAEVADILSDGYDGGLTLNSIIITLCVVRLKEPNDSTQVVLDTLRASGNNVDYVKRFFNSLTTRDDF